MSIKKSIKILIFSSALLVLPLIVFAQVPLLPHVFYGDITINGSLAPVGTVVIANVNGVEKGRVTTAVTGKYGGPGAYDQKLLVQGNDLSTGDTIHFTVSGVEASQTAQFESGKVEAKNLAFTITQAEVTNTTPNASSGGGGGGGGGGGVSATTNTSTSNSTLSAAAQRVDTNHDGKIGVLDFVSLMANWGKTEQNNIADFNGDGRVDIFDFVSLMANWTK